MLLKMMLEHNVLPCCCILAFKTVTLILTVSYRLSIKRHHVNFAQKYWNYNKVWSYFSTGYKWW